MRSHPRDHNRSPRKYASMLMLLLLFPTSNLYSQEKDSRNFRIMLGVTGGISKVRYDDINYQLERFHYLSGIKYSNPYGLEGMVIYKNRMIFNTLALFSDNTREKGGKWHGEISFLRSSIMGKIGIIPFSGKQNILYPYIGLALESLKARSNFNYYKKCGDCLFQGRSKYSINNLAFLYGIEYTRLLRIPRNSHSLGFGIEIGGSIALTDNPWYLVDAGHFWHRPDRPDFAGFDPGGFFKRVHIYYVLFE